MPTTDSSALVALSNDIAAVVEQVAPSVVAVEGRGGVGSTGFYLRPDLVLTADHTLESDDVEVVRAGGETVNATIVGRDPSTDLALLRTDASHAALEPAPAAGLRVGAIVLAVARDDDGDLAASMGVLSAVGDAWRTWHGGQVDRFVRPDLSLYARFSGSPLVDVAGRVIGLNTGGLARRQVITVPATTIERVVETLLAGGGRIPRGYLGVALQAVQGGAIVLGVEPGSPAERGGLIVGDVVVGAGDTPVEAADDVHAQLGSGTVGSTLRLTVRRGGVPRQLDVTVGERPEHEHTHEHAHHGHRHGRHRGRSSHGDEAER